MKKTRIAFAVCAAGALLIARSKRRDALRPEQRPADLPTGKRMMTLALASFGALKHRVLGQSQTDHGARMHTDDERVAGWIRTWPAAAQNGARQMIKQYGQPNEATPTKLLWYRNGPWKRTLVTSDEIVHNFPSPHTDYLTQYINYRVPLDKVALITEFDGSCLVDRTSGEAGARCDSEAANILTLNLMHRIVEGTPVEEARAIYAEQMVAYTLGRAAPLCEALQFESPRDGTADPDESVAGPAMVRQTGEKLKDVVGLPSNPARTR